MIRSAFVLCAVLIVTACGNNAGLQDTTALRQTVSGLFSPPPPAPDLRKILTPDFVAALGRPLLFVSVPDRGAQAGALLAQEVGTRRLWATQDRISLTLDAGVLTETRGFGGDLMTTDLGDTQAAIAGRVGSSVRIHRYLDGEDHLDAVAFVCTYVREAGVPVSTLARRFTAVRVDETCTGSDSTFENHYWLDPAGIPRKSTQWVSPSVGYAEFELLRDQ